MDSRLVMTRFAGDRPPRVSIVGAGLSGLLCARALVEHGLRADVFDKGTRPGGRLATRQHGPWEYDHGAQYFTISEPRFGKLVDEWRRDRLVAPWDARIVVFENGARRPAPPGTQRFVGVPGMNAIAARLAQDCAIRSGVRIESIARKDAAWTLRHIHGYEGPYDLVVVSVPAPQAIPLLEEAPQLREEAARVRMSGCWTVMVAFESGLDIDFDGAFVNEGPLSWIARNGAKPGRRGETWVLHASASWTREHAHLEPQHVTAALVQSFTDLAGVTLPSTAHSRAHLWRYALAENPLDEGSLFDPRLAVALCGDWCRGSKVEGACLSGLDAALQILDWAGIQTDRD